MRPARPRRPGLHLTDHPASAPSIRRPGGTRPCPTPSTLPRVGLVAVLALSLAGLCRGVRTVGPSAALTGATPSGAPTPSPRATADVTPAPSVSPGDTDTWVPSTPRTGMASRCAIRPIGTAESADHVWTLDEAANFASTGHERFPAKSHPGPRCRRQRLDRSSPGPDVGVWGPLRRSWPGRRSFAACGATAPCDGVLRFGRCRCVFGSPAILQPGGPRPPSLMTPLRSSRTSRRTE